MSFKSYRKCKVELETEITIIPVFIFVHVFTFTGDVYAALNYCPGFFHFKCRTPFSIPCEGCVVIMNSLSFCLSGNILISTSAFQHDFARYRILIWQLYHHIFFWSPKFLLRNQLLILLMIPSMWYVASLLLLSRFSFCLCFLSVLSWCVSVWVPGFILLVQWDSWICRFISVIKLGQNLVIFFSLQIIYLTLSLFPSKTHTVYNSSINGVPHRSLKLCLLFFILFSP